MRIRITIKADKIPILYRHRFIALIKEALKRTDTNYKEKLYPTGHLKVAKPFCFSMIMPYGWTEKKEKIIIDEDIEIEDTVFYLPANNPISLYVSSCDYQFIKNLYNGLLDTKEFNFNKEITLKLNKTFMLTEKEITHDEIVFKTNTPILIEDKKGKPILPLNSDSSFNNHFNAIHNRILKDIRGHGLYRELEFIPMKLKKQVIKHTLKEFREKTGKPYMTLTCFEGYFKLKGDPRDLQILYQIGIGLRTGQGFGMVEVV